MSDNPLGRPPQYMGRSAKRLLDVAGKATWVAWQRLAAACGPGPAATVEACRVQGAPRESPHSPCAPTTRARMSCPRSNALGRVGKVKRWHRMSAPCLFSRRPWSTSSDSSGDGPSRRPEHARSSEARRRPLRVATTRCRFMIARALALGRRRDVVLPAYARVPLLRRIRNTPDVAEARVLDESPELGEVVFGLAGERR